MRKKRDNTERYRRFSDSYKKAFMSATKEKGEKEMDVEWNQQWKLCKDDEKFEQRILQLKARAEKKTILHSFSFTKRAKLDSGASGSGSSSLSIPNVNSPN